MLYPCSMLPYFVVVQFIWTLSSGLCLKYKTISRFEITNSILTIISTEFIGRRRLDGDDWTETIGRRRLDGDDWTETIWRRRLDGDDLTETIGRRRVDGDNWPGRTFLHHADGEALLKATELAAVPASFVNRTLLLGETHVFRSLLYRSLYRQKTVS